MAVFRGLSKFDKKVSISNSRPLSVFGYRCRGSPDAALVADSLKKILNWADAVPTNEAAKIVNLKIGKIDEKSIDY